jgi:hypothetical protein
VDPYGLFKLNPACERAKERLRRAIKEYEKALAKEEKLEKVRDIAFKKCQEEINRRMIEHVEKSINEGLCRSPGFPTWKYLAKEIPACRTYLEARKFLPGAQAERLAAAGKVARYTVLVAIVCK